MTTLHLVELGVLGPLQVRRNGAPVAIPGAKPRAILTMLGLHGGAVVSAETFFELLWGEDPPRTAAKALQTHISALRRALGDGFVLTKGAGWALAESELDASRYRSAARLGRDAAAAGDISQAVACFEEALALWRGTPELPDGRRGTSEKTRWVEGHAALVEDRADALLATGRAAELVGDLEAAVADAPLRERRWGQLMLALYRAGRQGDALSAYQRARTLLADELGIDPGPELRRLETAIVAQSAELEVVAARNVPSVMRAVTFLLTDIEGSTAAWEAEPDVMASALARHDELVEQVVTSRAGRLIKTRGEGDATFSVFERPSAAAAAAIELQDAVAQEPWTLRAPICIRVALHTGEVELRDGDYFGRAVNRAARLRSLAVGGQTLCSGATAELVIDSLPEHVMLADLGLRELRNLARPEHVFELRLKIAEGDAQPPTSDPPIERPGLPAVLVGTGPFVGRGNELERLYAVWQTTLGGGARAALVAGEPGVGKTRLAGEWSRQAYEQGAVVLYGRCDEDLGAPYQPFAESLRSLVPCVGTTRLRGLRGVEALLSLVPGLIDVVPDLAAPTRADPDTERYALFDAVVALLETASKAVPLVLVLDDLHWAGKPTLLLLRHLLRFGDNARVQIVGTYRSTDLDRSHPLAAMLADLHRDGTSNRINLSGLDEDDVTAYVARAGYDDEELGRALASVTGGNPFFLIEALRHVDESGGVWDPSTLPQGVREAVSRRLSRLPVETNKSLAAAAVVGSRFALDLVERVVGEDLVDAFDEAAKAGIVIEEPGGHYRFNHAIVRQSLLAELPSVRRMRLHQRIATTLEDELGDDDELLAELAHHYFECAWAGNAAKAVEYCRRAADQAMTRLAYEGAADLYGHALHAMDELDDDLPDRDDQVADLLVARCEALLAAGDVASAAGAVAQLQRATVDSARLSAWATCFDGQLSILVHPERLDDVEAGLGVAAHRLAEIDDPAGEAKAHTVRAQCLARLGRVGDCEIALDDALTAARRARDHRRVNAVLAGAPLAALWGPNPVPRAGGRCLDVVRLLRITTDSPAVEATSTRCQAVLEAFRGREAAARRMIDSARRTVTELGLRHALLEVEQFAGIVELVLDNPAAAEPHLRQAYNGFRRMGLDADTAETAALLGRACLELNRDAEADELCTESERLAGNALKASIAWRTLRAQLLSHSSDHVEARRVAQAAVTLAERTDGLVDHGDACLSLATVLGAAGDSAGARAAAERSTTLYELKGAAALADKARRALDEPSITSVPTPPELPPVIELDTACVRAGERVAAAVNRADWDEYERLVAPEASLESRRKIVGFTPTDVPFDDWQRQNRRILETGETRLDYVFIAVRGERLALSRLKVGTGDASPGAPIDEFLQVYGIDEEGRVAFQIWFDVEDMDAAIAELDAVHARFEDERSQTRHLENTATRVFERVWSQFATGDWNALAESVSESYSGIDHRRVVNAENQHGRDAVVNDLKVAADVGFTISMVDVIAVRGEHLALTRVRAAGRDPEAIQNDALNVIEIDSDEKILAAVTFDLENFDAAIAELDARYLTGEGAADMHTWSVVAAAYAGFNRRELPAATPGWVNIDHRRGAAFAPGDMMAYMQAAWEDSPDTKIYIGAVHRLSSIGAVVTHSARGVSQEGFDAEWRDVHVLGVGGDRLSRSELFDEADLDAAIARFDQLSRPAPQLENAASRVTERFQAHFAARDWAAMGTILADEFSSDDRRRVVGAGVRDGRHAEIADMAATADLGVSHVKSTVLATRGDRLTLMCGSFSGRDQGPGAFHSEALGIVEIDRSERIIAFVTFDLDDIDAALAELDARYCAGEAAPYSRVWSVILGAYAALNRREMPSTTPDWVNIDHRRGASFAPGELPVLLANWNPPDLSFSIEAVHRLNELGAVFSSVSHETSQDGFAAEWRTADILTVDGDLINRCEIFEEADLDTAIATFDQLTRPAPQLENTASRVYGRLRAYFAARDWAAMAAMLADDSSMDDRRRVVGSEVRRGQDATMAAWRAIAEIGVTKTTSVVIATRGTRLAMCRTQASTSGAFDADVFQIVDIDADERMAAVVTFDLDDFDAAIAELDARYLAGEGAAYARTWSALTMAFAAVNRHELPKLTPGWVNIDHRRGATFAAGDMTAYIHDLWADSPDINMYIEVVHRLNSIGAVITQAAHGTSQHGFEAEWRENSIFTFDGDLVSRCELFDEEDLDAALTGFDKLSPPTTQLENTASRVAERFSLHFAAREWDAITGMLTHDASNHDRRRLLGAGVRQSRDAFLAEILAVAELGVEWMTSKIVATRGEHLVMRRAQTWGRDQRPEAFHTDVLDIIEINGREQLLARIVFDLEDFDAAIAELESRYITGEAAACGRTWSAISGSYAAINRHELPSTTPDCVNIDRRRETAMGVGDLIEYIGAGAGRDQDNTVCVEAVHRLANAGAVVTYAAHETSQEGFDAEWRGIAVTTVEGELVNRTELFDEADLAAALARFQELSRPTPQLENTASRTNARFVACFNARDWDALALILTDDYYNDDRRRITGTGIRRGRHAEIENLQVVADFGTTVTVEVIATRGDRLVLTRIHAFTNQQQGFLAEAIFVIETDVDGRFAATIMLDVEDFEAAFKELDARYVAGEAAAHARTWRVIAESYASVNRHEFPAISTNSVFVDHRRAAAFGASDLSAYLRAGWDLGQIVRPYVEAVHRMNDLGAVCSYAAHGVSRDGFDAEWQGVDLVTVDGDMIDRHEFFDGDALDAALARFEELSRPTPRLENTASRVDKRFQGCFAVRDWDTMAQMLADGFSTEDRRRVVNMGNLSGREAELTVHAYAAGGTENVTSTVIATRGQRLALSHYRFSGRDQLPDAFRVEMLVVVEIDTDERMAAVVVFDAGEIDAAVAELDARYVAGEAAAYGPTWSVIAGAYAALNQHEFPATTPESVSIDHRGETMFGPADLIAYLRARLDFEQDFNIYPEAVHRLTGLGAVVTYAAHATSQEGFEAEWRGASVFAVEGDMLHRWEVFDEADLDVALTQFEQLSRPVPQLENSAARAYERLQECFAARDWDALAETLANEAIHDDRRRVVGGFREGRHAVVAEFSVFAEIGVKRITFDPIATRGSRLVLSRSRASGRDRRADAFRTDVLSIAEIDANERIKALITFDPDDFDAAFEELEKRYLAGEAAAHADVWSVIASGFGALRRSELPLTAPECVSIDHRRTAAFAPGELSAYTRAAFDLTADHRIYVEAVHRLNDGGVVCTHVTHGVSHEGFAAEWREVAVLMVEGDIVNRAELFDEADFDDAVATFKELSPHEGRLEHPVQERFLAHFAARDWDAMGQDIADDYYCDDRRRVVNAGVRHGRDAALEDLRVAAEIGLMTNITSDIIATRGERLFLGRTRWLGADQRPEDFHTEILNVVEIDPEERIAAQVLFDPNEIADVAAAFNELDARYLAGHAVAHAHTWSLVADAFAAINRHELPKRSPDWVNVDHRRGAAFAAGEMTAYIDDLFDDVPDINVYAEVVHRLGNRGAVITQAGQGTSQEGLQAEWREIGIFVFDGDLLSRYELFDDADLDAALARFDELHSQARQPENAASQVEQRFLTYFAARDWDAYAEILTDDVRIEDRRHVVNAGVRHGRDSEIANVRALADIGLRSATSTVIAVRGERLFLGRHDVWGGWSDSEAAQTLCILEINAEHQIVARIVFDPDDIDAAFAELDARYLAGEAAAHAHTWSDITQAYAAINRHEMPPTTPDWVNIDHRRALAFVPGDLPAYLHATWELAPDFNVYVEAVHRLSNLGGVLTHCAQGSSHDGFDAEWREVAVLIFEGELISRAEFFDEAELDAALARFDELDRL